MQFDSIDKFRTKVHNSWLRVYTTEAMDKDPVFSKMSVSSALSPDDGSFMVTVFPAGRDDSAFTLKATSKRILYEIPKAGLFLFDGALVEFSRLPTRSYKLGSDNGNSSFTDITNPEAPRVLTWGSGVRTVSFHDMLKGKYMSPLEAAAFLKKHGRPVPIGPKSFLKMNDIGTVSLYTTTGLVCWFYHGNVNFKMKMSEGMIKALCGKTSEELARDIENA